ncbi:DUF6438 domain-containing protein [Chelativorans sp.]|uniref:DUF6438 domain-containing protein n=1 Tax=Chelativorans sp. TaxID=2203393 RepID=UPI002811DA7A|nr:DUF6438 domain-containing protein [Chelativorans sp.]
MALTLLVLSAESAPAESITVERGPCLGECPVYRIEVSASGEGTFDGRRFTAVQGQRKFSITRQEWSAFQGVLAPYRPRGTEDITPGHPRCRQMATDHPSIIVTWAEGKRTDRLIFNYGCKDPENAAMARVLSDAPDLLPVGEFIEERRLEDGAWDRHPSTDHSR